MSYFQWAEDMAIDHGPIDEDHKKLIAHVNLLHTATSEGRGQEMVAMLVQLVTIVQQHQLPQFLALQVLTETQIKVN